MSASWCKAIKTAVTGAIILAAPAANASNGELELQVNETLGLARSSVFQLDVQVGTAGAVTTMLEIDGLPEILLATPHSVRSEAYEVLAQLDGGQLVPVAPSPVNTLRGELLAWPGSRVAASLLADGLHARILMPGGRELWIEPVAGRVPGALAGTHVLYETIDVLETGATCGLDALPDAAAHRDEAVGGDQGIPEGGALQVAELACDADYEYFLDYGASDSAVQARINQVINAMNLQYETEVGITHSITTILVRTSSNQPYTSTDAVTLLNQFRNQWNNNHGNIQRDVAQLFTGKEVDGGTIGIAWVGVVCNLSFAYNLVQSDFNNNFSCATDLSAHELGHNWNADHCNCTNPPYTMNPFITCANTFSPTQTISTIVNFRNSRTCLDTGGGPTGACCVAASCTLETSADCAVMGGTYLGDGTDCGGNPCGPPTGGCCEGTSCSIQTAGDCSTLGGTYLGDGTDCAGDPCAPPTGGCCEGTSCSIQTAGDCSTLGRTYLGDGTDCTGNPCSSDVTNLATADFQTSEGSIASGTYLDTRTQNDVYEELREGHTGGPPSQRVSLLDHTWTFQVAAGTSYAFSIDAYHQANSEGDDFVLSYSLDNVSFTDMLVVTKTADDDSLQTYGFSEDIAGTVYVRVEDLNRTPGNRFTHSFFVDEMFITSVTDGPDVTPPPMPTGLVATPGDGVVALDWDDSPAGDLDGYIVYRSTTSGGPYGSITAVLAVSDHTDTAVANGTTYYYVVTALDLVGNESDDSDEVAATPQPPGIPTTMSVSAIQASVLNEGGGNKRGRVLVTILDDQGNPVDNATVTGTFSGDYNETVSAPTGAGGVATLNTTATARGGINYTFCVDNVTHATLSYEPGGNAQTCGTN